MSHYATDLQNDRILSVYLDGLYTRLGLSFQRIEDLSLQHQGVDILLTGGDRTFKVDEKAQMHYRNRSLPTFAFEIGYLKDGVRHKGWLFDEHKTTDVYFLVVHIYTDREELTSPEQIKSCRILRIGRARLVAELAKQGVTYETCHQQELEARKNNVFGRIPVAKERMFSFNCNKDLDEQPFNLVIRLDMLLTVGKWLV